MASNATKERRLYLLDKLLGYEGKEFPSEVDEKRASYMKNMLCVDGLNKKRNGWREIYSFYDENDTPLRVNGIFEYNNSLIVHAGSFLYKCDTGCEKIQSELSLANENSCAFENDGLLYIVSGGRLFVFNGTELKSAFNSEYAYIPTTRVDISALDENLSCKENESSNLLTSRRKNTLIGVGRERARFELDRSVDLNEEISVKTKISIALGSTDTNTAPYFAYHKDSERLLENNIGGISGFADYDAIYKLLNGEGIPYNLAEVEEVMLFLKEPMKIDSAILYASLGNAVPRVAFFLDSDVIYDTGATSEYRTLDLTASLYGQVVDAICFYGSHDNGIIEAINICGRVAYEGEIEITHTNRGISYNQALLPTSVLSRDGREVVLCRNKTGSAIFNPTIWFEPSGALVLGFNSVGQIKDRSNIEISFCEENIKKPCFYIGGVAKTNTGSGTLVLSTDDCCACISHPQGGFGYFPKDLKIKLGSYGKISAICPMADLTLAVYKENEAYNLAINEENGVYSVSVSGCSVGLGSLSHFATLSVNNDTLCPTRRGIFGSVGYERDGFFERSSNIARELRSYDLRNALALENEGRYYLFIDGKVFVADTKYKIASDNGSFEYEWWVLDNCPVSAVGNINNKILMGRQDGKIVTFYDEYRDIYYDALEKGNYLIKKDSDSRAIIYLNDSLGLKDEDKLIVNGGYCYLSNISEAFLDANGNLKIFVPFDSFWSTSGTIKYYPNMMLYLLGENGGFIEAKVLEVFPYECSVVFDLQENNDTYSCLLKKNENGLYTLMENEDHFYLLNEYGNKAILYEAENCTLKCERGKNVEGEIISAAIAPLGYFKSKALYKLSFNLICESGGQIELGYETDSSANLKLWAMQGGLNFDKLDFNSISLKSDFSRSYHLRCFERAFKYLIFKLKHTENRGFTFKSAVIYYEENDI